MTEERGHVLVLGSINADLVVRVTHLPAPGETVTGGVFDRHQGGKGANQAVAAARLGARVTMVGSVGDDELGGLARDSLRGEGVDVEAVRRSHGPTGVALIVVDDAGENQIAVASGANSDVGPEALRDVDLVRGGVFLSNFEVPDEAVVPGAIAAAEAGMRLIINPAPARDISAALLRAGPILVPNEGEAQTLTGELDAVAAARVLAGRSGMPVVVTLGPQGAIVVDEGSVERITAPLYDAVDTTGAGDAFLGALAAELAIGRSLLEAVRFAVVAASLSVTVPGAREGMPTRAQVAAALEGMTQ